MVDGTASLWCHFPVFLHNLGDLTAASSSCSVAVGPFCQGPPETLSSHLALTLSTWLPWVPACPHNLLMPAPAFPPQWLLICCSHGFSKPHSPVRTPPWPCTLTRMQRSPLGAVLLPASWLHTAWVPSQRLLPRGDPWFSQEDGQAPGEEPRPSCWLTLVATR